MEKALHDRDVVGVQDFVLLENYQSEEAFLDNLKKRFQENLIYVSTQSDDRNIYQMTFYMIFFHLWTDIYRTGIDIS